MTSWKQLGAALVAVLGLAACSEKPAPPPAKTDAAAPAKAPQADAPKADAPKADAPKAPEPPKAAAPTAAAPKGEPSTTLPPKGEPSTTLPPKTDAPKAAAKPALVPDKDGWMPLFDGRTLMNWMPADFAGHGEVAVKDGALHIPMGQPMTGIVWDGPEIPRQDYEIELEAKKLDGGDFFCALTFPYNKESCTFVCGGWGGIVVGLSSVDGYDASENQTTKTMNFELNKWYLIKVRSTKAKIECWIDGEKMVDLETAEKRIGIRIECEPCVPLGVASFQTTGAIRNFRVKKVS